MRLRPVIAAGSGRSPAAARWPRGWPAQRHLCSGRVRVASYLVTSILTEADGRDVSSPSRYHAIRGRVVGITTEGGAEHIEALAHRYLGAPYPWYGGRDQVRVILTVRADKIHEIGWARQRHG